MRGAAAALLGALLPALAAHPAAAGEAVPFRDADALFTIALPAGWTADDSGHMGPGLVAKGAAPEGGGPAPLIHLTHEPAGIVTLDVRWHTLLGQMRFDYEALRYLSLEDHEDAAPPWSQALYSYRRDGRDVVALTRLVLAGGRFFLMTAVAPGEVFTGLHPAFLETFASFRPGAADAP